MLLELWCQRKNEESDKLELSSALSFIFATKLSPCGVVLNVDEEAIPSISGAITVLGVRILAGVLDSGNKASAVLGDFHLLIHVESLPGPYTGVFGIVEWNDGRALNLRNREVLAVGKVSLVSAAIIVCAFLLVGSIGVSAASGIRLVPGEPGGLGKGSNYQWGGDDELLEHYLLIFIKQL